MQIKYIFILPILFFTSFATANNYAQRPEVQLFIDEMEEKHQFNQDELQALFTQAEKQHQVIELMQRPAEAKPWHKYHPIFVTTERAEGGRAFWMQHESTFVTVQQRYGVPPQVIAAIIGAETNYGKNKGNFPVFDTLTTLAFDYPRRAPFFRSELEQYLLLTREEQLPPLALKGSYAGAMGAPQFISSSYRAYAVDFDNGNQRNLLNNTDDVIASVGNYFYRHGWQPNGPIAVRATIQGNEYKKLLNTEYREGMNVLKPHKPIMRLSEFKKYGITPTSTIAGDEKACLIELETANGKEYWLGFNNFYVITRYNHSNLYAMAVYQLSEEILEKHQKV